MTSLHKIPKMIIDLDIEQPERVEPVYSAVSHVFNNRMVSMLDEVLTAEDKADELIVFRSLEIDLGPILHNELETELYLRTREALEQELRYRLHLLSVNPGAWGDAVQRIPAGTSLLNKLRYFLLNGHLPWYAGRNDVFDINRAVPELAARDTENLRVLLMSAGELYKVRERLVFQVWEEGLKTIIEVAEPGEAGFILAYRAQLKKDQQHRQLVKDEGTAFERSVWIFILTYLFVEQGNNFNRKEFIKSTLRQMAAHYNLEYRQVTEFFFRGLAELTNTYHTGLKVLLAEVFEENHPVPVFIPGALPFQQVHGHQAEAFRIEEKMLLLRHYLLTGSLFQAAGGQGPGELSKWFAELMETVPSTLVEMLTETGQAGEVRWRIVHLLEEQSLEKLVSVLEPAEHTFILTYLEATTASGFPKTNVAAEEKTFRRSAWYFILTYLLADRGSEFNNRMFASSVLKQTAAHYNIQYRELVSGFMQALSGEFSRGKEYNRIFRFLKELFAELDENKVDAAQQDQTRSAGSAVAELPGVVQEENNPVMYFLLHGRFPWWLAPGAVDPVVWLKKLFFSSEETLSLFKLARQRPAAAHRLMQYTTAEDWIKALEKIGLGIGLLARSFIGADQQLLKRSLLEAFTAEPLPSFHIQVFLARMMTGTQPAEKKEGLLKEIEKLPFLTTMERRELAPDGDREILAASLPTVNNPAPETLNRELFLKLSGYSAGGKETFAHAVSSILSRFLLFNSLPRGFDARKDVLLQWMIREWFREDKNALHNLWNRPYASVAARMYIYELFLTGTGTGDKELREMFRSFLPADMLFIAGAGSNETFQGKGADSHFQDIIALLAVSPQKKKDFLSVIARSASARAWLLADPVTRIYPMLDGLSNLRLEIQTSQLFGSLTELFRSLSPSTQETTELLRHFHAFNLDLLTGKYAAYSVHEYLLLLLRYLDDWKVSGAILKKLETKALSGWTGSGATDLSAHFREIFIQPRLPSENLQSRIREELVKTGPVLTDQQTPLPIEEEGKLIYIENAGAVLLCPFLPHLFLQCGLLEKGAFNGKEAGYKAISLIQYLVWERHNHPEQELVLNKILCGIPTEEPVRGVELSAGDLDLCSGLLKAVIQQWTKLGNTSEEGLRVSFLQRGGTLKNTPDGWVLQVEQKGIDVLIQYIPWGISMVRTPWMNQFLTVEWI